jgi:hypothetical protein
MSVHLHVSSLQPVDRFPGAKGTATSGSTVQGVAKRGNKINIFNENILNFRAQQILIEGNKRKFNKLL